MTEELALSKTSVLSLNHPQKSISGPKKQLFAIIVPVISDTSPTAGVPVWQRVV